jgi:uncharacterized ferritin-like protein (DUF455 family)
VDRDPVMSEIMDFLLVDELNHVKNGNRWIHHLLGGDPKRIAALEEQAYAKIRAANLASVPPPVWPEGRLTAGFSAEEVAAYTAHRSELVAAAQAPTRSS